MGHRFHNHNLHIHERKKFLPMLCSRHTIKDVMLPKLEDSSSSSFSEDPLSPKISCIGQVKRHNKVIGFPTSQRLTFTPINSTSKNNNISNVNYSKLKKFFSSKNLTAATANNSCSFRNPRRVPVDESKCVSINIEAMDPPLPVVKRVVEKAAAQEIEPKSIWKRRQGGIVLKGLQLEQIQHQRHHLQPTTVWYYGKKMSFSGFIILWLVVIVINVLF